MSQDVPYSNSRCLAYLGKKDEKPIGCQSARCSVNSDLFIDPTNPSRLVITKDYCDRFRPVIKHVQDTEKRRPQDGRIKTDKGGVEAEIRISTVPVAFGEKVVMRIMDPDILFQDLDWELEF